MPVSGIKVIYSHPVPLLHNILDITEIVKLDALWQKFEFEKKRKKKVELKLTRRRQKGFSPQEATRTSLILLLKTLERGRTIIGYSVSPSWWYGG